MDEYELMKMRKVIYNHNSLRYIEFCNNKKDKMEDVFSIGRQEEVAVYEVMKARMIVQNHILRHVQLCKGKGLK